MLVHFIWQGAAIAVLLAIALQILRRKSANARYVAACLAMLLMAVLPVLTLSKVSASKEKQILHKPAVQSAAQTGLESVKPLPTLTAEPPQSGEDRVAPTSSRSEALISLRHNISVLVEPYLPIAVLIWLLGVFLLSSWRVGGWIELQRFKKKQVKPIADEWAEKIKRIAQKVGVSRPMRVLESAVAQVPSAIGWLKPVLLIPTSALTGLPPNQLEAIIAHELAHIRRHDYLTNLIQTAVETLFFYHPVVWWVSHKIRIEREHCCDEIAVRVCGDAFSYAYALTKLEEMRHASAQLAMAASGGHLLNRIQHLLNIRSPHSGRSNVWAAGSVGVVLILCVFAQQVAVSARSSDKPVGIFENYTDIGPVPTPGEVKYDPATDTYHIAGSGRGGSNAGDELFFVYRKTTGSWCTEATLCWPRAPSDSAAIGLTCRESLDADSKRVNTWYFGEMLWIRTNWRENTGGVTAGSGNTLSQDLRGKPIRCRVTRLAPEDQFIHEWYNPRTEKWITISSVTVEMRDEVLVGLAAHSSAGNAASPAEGLIRDVKTTSFSLGEPDAGQPEDERIGPVIGTRTLEDTDSLPGGRAHVTIYVAGERGAVKVEETPPTGWTISDVSSGGTVTAGVITWNLASFAGSETLTYVVTPPSNPTESRLFSGKVGDLEIVDMTSVVTPEPLGIFENHVDVGGPDAPGHATYNSLTGEYQIKASDTDMDISYHFAYREVIGDFSLKARIRTENLDATHPSAGAGLVVVDSLATDFRFYSVKVFAAHSNVMTCWGRAPGWNWKTASLNLSTNAKDGQLEIVREGNAFTAYHIDLTTGERTLFDALTGEFEEPVYVGLFAHSTDAGRYTMGYFTDVELSVGSGQLAVGRMEE